MTSRAGRGARRAFTLIELLLAVFILAIGIISVTALFPAGIVQQQRAQDDQFGPVVAEAALGVLRNRLDAAQFGTFEEHGQTNVLAASTFPTRGSFVFRSTVGDWSWARPSLYRVISGGWVPGRQPDGAIDVFGSAKLQTEYPGQTGQFFHEFANNPMGSVRGIPFNRVRSLAPTEPPSVIVTWRERCWPMIAEGDAGDRVTPEYMWDCMFRRTGGRMQVAIFVYRVTGQGGARKAWVPTALMPVRKVFAPVGAGAEIVAPAWEAKEPPEAPPTGPNPFTTGTIGAAQGLLPTDFSAAGGLPAFANQWQMPGQWIIDNYGGVHRVLRGRALGGASESVDVRLSVPIVVPPKSEAVGDYELELAGRQLRMGMRAFHFVPILPDAAVQIVPVYATVRDL
jgi:prepilin-type N-terminal cleavage/methylation domain-containing protein